MNRSIWLVTPYGTIEGENWRDFRFNQFSKYLSENGFSVVWWTANFSHHFKTYRSKGQQDIHVNNNYIIRLIPTTAYKKNFSFARLRKDYVFAKNFLKSSKRLETPDLIIADDNPLLMGSPSYIYAQRNGVPLIYDQMDIWPEFMVDMLPSYLRKIASVLLSPVYKKRIKIYGELAGGISLGKHYLDFMLNVNDKLKEKPYELVYNGIDVAEFRSKLGDEIQNKTVKELVKDTNDIWCIFAGTLGPSYDIDGIISCAYKLKELGNKRFKFLVAGSGPLAEDIIKAERELDNLLFLGKLLPHELIPIYGKCDIGLATYTAGSNVDMCDKFYDYTAAGLAIVNSLKGEISEHIHNKNIGVNYRANDHEDLLKALLSLETPSVLSEVKKNSYNAAEMFDMNCQNAKLLSLINRVLGI